MMDNIISELKIKLRKSYEHLKSDLATIRCSTANASLVSDLQVEVYDTVMTISELASITTPRPTLIIIQPWDISIIPAIEKTINDSLMNVSAVVDEKLIRIPLPPLSEERREEFVKLVRQKVESAKIAIRQNRREALDTVKTGKQENTISEDEEFRLKKLIEKEVEKVSDEIDDLFKRKEQELRHI